RSLDRVDAPEFFQQALLACGTEAGDVVDGRASHALVAQLTVVRNREPVRLVTNALQQIQRFGLPRQTDRVAAPRHEHLFELLGQLAHGNLVFETELAQHSLSHAQLTLPAL